MVFDFFFLLLRVLLHRNERLLYSKEFRNTENVISLHVPLQLHIYYEVIETDQY